ncbi:MAG: hypothetical protein J6Q55_00500, partial [Clostridia bacterium]|nr:hypothetical protein [Clostridia bacterium]
NEIMTKAKLAALRYERTDDLGNVVYYADGTPTMDKLVISLEASPTGMHGLSHRELGDYTNSYAFLLETSDAAEGRIRGAFVPGLITYYSNGPYAYQDKFYEYLAALDAKSGKNGHNGGYLYVPPVSIDERVARHTLTIQSLVTGYNMVGYARSNYSHSFLQEDLRHSATDNLYRGSFIMGNIPSYNDIYYKGVGSYLTLDPNA